MIRFLLCGQCRRAWTAAAVTPCCSADPLDCSPWGSDRKVWLRERLGDIRMAAMFVCAQYSEKWEHRASIARGVAARRNTWAEGRVA